MINYSISVILSAFLLFLIQPMISKMILPWFGGTSTVWTTSVMFFQVVLLVGYAYSHWLSKAASQRNALSVHRIMLLVSLGVLLLNGVFGLTPLTPGDAFQPDQAIFPILRIILILLVTVGLPYFMLSTNSLIVQTLYQRHYNKKEPYWLYAVSNVGSLVALLAYPFIVEPTLDIVWQSWLWTVAYAFYVVLTIILLSNLQNQDSVITGKAESAQHIPVRFTRLYPLWFLLSFATNVLYLSATNRMTQDIAPMPFLWVVPMAVYLFTFVLTFSRDKGYSRWMMVFFIVALNLFVITLVRGNSLPILLQLNIYVMLVFGGSMVAHGELVRMRPPAEHLTVFYLIQAIGGAAGGVFVNLIAPSIFKGYWELLLSVSLILVLLAVCLMRDRESPLYHKWLRVPVGLLLLSGVFSIVMNFTPYISSYNYQTEFGKRNFYGILRIKTDETESGDKVYTMVHGTTVHGLQYAKPDLWSQPTTYYTESSGVGRILDVMMRAHEDVRVGVIGMGVGTLATYARPQDQYVMFEINPAVIEFAYDTRFFHFLTECPAALTVIEGDGRLALERELTEGYRASYDVLVLDAFNGDSIPIHLLTQEAFELYLQLLAEHGVLALHVSNSHLNFQPVVKLVADYFGLYSVYIEDTSTSDLEGFSSWILLSRDPALLDDDLIASVAQPLESGDSKLRLWTDNYSNLFQILIRE